ncbi:hypothetical protein [Rubrivirga sp.]|uniref:hypothetical protein n=1 Tax=Rubrivirga sp. TaxID=1885344 RepID=UPI003C754EE4
MTLRLLALLLIASSSASAQRERTGPPPHLLPLVWDADDLKDQEIALDDSTYIVFEVPSAMHRWHGFAKADRRIEGCVGGHWAPSALATVRLYERYGVTDEYGDMVSTSSLLEREERPLFCVEPWLIEPRENDILWISHPRDTLAVTTMRTALELCTPDCDPGFECALPELADRFTTPHGLEVAAVTLRFSEGYDGEPEPDAHLIGPFFVLETTSMRYPYLYLNPRRIITWVAEDASYTDDELAFMRHVIDSARIYEFDEPVDY